jgi:putative ATP-dependent endonuclease of OLD family
MKISRIQISNFRLLKSLSLDLEDNLSLVIGKNNCGKTSLLAILDKFLNEKSTKVGFESDDFNLQFQKELKQYVIGKNTYDGKSYLGISMKLFIDYDEKDNLFPVSNLIMDLHPDNKKIVLLFEYAMNQEALERFKVDYKVYLTDKTLKIKNSIKQRLLAKRIEKAEAKLIEKAKIERIFSIFLGQNHPAYFTSDKKTIHYDHLHDIDNEKTFISLKKENIKLDKLINFKLISAKRDVSNNGQDHTLSGLSSKYYEIREAQSADSDAIVQFKDTLEETDDHLDGVYPGLFKDVLETVSQFGGIRAGESIIKIISNLQHRELLKGNTTVMYDHNQEHALPEHYNGLGYMNLIGMIFEIEVLLSDFRRAGKKDELPAAINLLFIEEPEAHTHPQMQYIFIKNIKDILKKASKGGVDKLPFFLQTIITTHSSHITAQSDFSDLKYFTRTASNTVVAKNVKDLKTIYGKEDVRYDFLKQYLTINRTELFFADKVILIEGDTERLLLSSIMHKLDLQRKDEALVPLLSQNISIVEVGAHAQIFEKLIDFLNLKTLIITDIDTYKMEVAINKQTGEQRKHKKTGKDITYPNACRVVEAEGYGNNAISLYTGRLSFDELKSLAPGSTICSFRTGKWKVDPKGTLYLAFQQNEGDYHARSYEDAFFSLNRSFIIDNLDKFPSLKNKDYIEELDPYDFAQECIGHKTSFALDILYASNEKYTNWKIPSYIKNGLEWLGI